MRICTTDEWPGSIARRCEQALLQQADAALYESKRSGRNRVIVHQPESALALDATPFDGVGSA